MFKIKISLAVLVLLSSSALAQLKVEVSQATTMTSSLVTVTTEIIGPGGETLDATEKTGLPTLPVVAKQTIVTVYTDAKNVSVFADNVNRDPVELTRVGNRTWLIPPGKVWLDVRAIDFDKNIYETTKLNVVGIGSEPKPGPVANDYMVGQASADNAPLDKTTRAEVAKHHRQAAEFLYGRPSLKSVSSENDDSPETNVFSWLNAQAQAMQCPDVETCKQWATWRQAVGEAFQESQSTRQFSKADWYKALNEIAGSLE
tara:strand:- start:1023 stop:1796 length:774 start_codon:yes stop_codon:yes gene_type:complete